MDTLGHPPSGGGQVSQFSEPQQLSTWVVLSLSAFCKADGQRFVAAFSPSSSANAVWIIHCHSDIILPSVEMDLK